MTDLTSIGLHSVWYYKKWINISTRVHVDQFFVSGIGNIYASEILFMSKVNPFKKVKLLSKKECQKIITVVLRVLPTNLRLSLYYL